MNWTVRSPDCLRAVAQPDSFELRGEVQRSIGSLPISDRFQLLREIACQKLYCDATLHALQGLADFVHEVGDGRVRRAALVRQSIVANAVQKAVYLCNCGYQPPAQERVGLPVAMLPKRISKQTGCEGDITHDQSYVGLPVFLSIVQSLYKASSGVKEFATRRLLTAFH